MRAPVWRQPEKMGAYVCGELTTLLTTESCLLNANRNPDLSKADIEERLRLFLGIDVELRQPLTFLAELGFFHPSVLLSASWRVLDGMPSVPE